MKIYTPISIPKNIYDLNLLQINITQYKDIYSSDGIFRIQNDNIYQLIPQDKPIEKTTYNNTEFIIDKSYFSFRNEIYCIPIIHLEFNIEYIEFKLNNKSKISLIIEKTNNIIIDTYFYTKENNLHNYLKDDILLIHSLLNNNKQY
uniref:Uncharacterized protein n=1 Tax=viral metagenome TaxID=1070528 RepID=A0A6C0AYP1_9ZZZZ|tara:strand:- start:4989 stop:5426 length:438 start_codon:yes stop_codon:yes gene_type:complete